MASNKESTQAIHRESVGPDYVSKNHKPEATVSTAVSFPNVHVLAQTPQLIALLTQVQPHTLILSYADNAGVKV
jgi:uracil phosphoribosyltransferase